MAEINIPRSIPAPYNRQSLDEKYHSLFDNILMAVTSSRRTEQGGKPIFSPEDENGNTIPKLVGEKLKWDTDYFYDFVRHVPIGTAQFLKLVTNHIGVSKSTWNSMKDNGLPTKSQVEKVFCLSAYLAKQNITDRLASYIRFAEEPLESNHPKVQLYGTRQFENEIKSLLEHTNTGDNDKETRRPHSNCEDTEHQSHRNPSDSILVRSPILERALQEPLYVLKSEKQDKEISLNPLDHHSIELEGRESQLDELDAFLNDKDKPFSILPIIGPSGSGKTRLASQWLHDRVDKSQWQAGFVTSSKDEPWKKWEPTCNTLIIIDYIYRFKNVIREIVEIAKKEKQHNVRLVVLDHVFPQNLNEIYRDFFSEALVEGKKQLDTRKAYFSDAIYLESLPNRVDILSAIIAKVSGEKKKSEAVKSALSTLRSMCSQDVVKNEFKRANPSRKMNEPAAHPLFAILIGLALKRGQCIENWARHDLIDYYFSSSERLPWKVQNNTGEVDEHGKWVAAFVAAATIRRGISYESLIHCIANRKNSRGERYSYEDHRKIKNWCQRIVSSKDDEWLKPFEPDILGENFFLLFFQYFSHSKEVLNAFIRMICTAEEGEQERVSKKYIEFSIRLTINLSNDDQSSYYTRDSWKAISKFLNPKFYRKFKVFQYVVSKTNLRLCEILDAKGFSNQRASFLKNIHEQSLVKEFEFYNQKNILHGEEIIGRQTLRCDLIYYYNLILSDNNIDELEYKLVALYQEEYRHISVEKRTLFCLNGCLVSASYLGCAKLVEILVKYYGCDVHFIDPYDDAPDLNPPLIAAAWTGQWKVAKLLINEGADPSFQNAFGANIFLAACHGGNKKLINYLFETNNIKLTPPDQSGRNTGAIELESAWDNRDLKLVERLVNIGVDIDGRTYLGDSILVRATIQNDKDKILFLLNLGANVNNSRDRHGRTALFYSCKNRNFELIKLFLDLGAWDFSDDSPLVIACEKGYSDIAELLLSKSKEVGLSMVKEAAFRAAIRNDQVDIIELLIPEVSDINFTEEKLGYNSLMIASKYNSYSAIKSLIENHAKLNAVDIQGYTALMIASQSGNFEAAEVLLRDKTTRVNIVLPTNWNALMLACKNRHAKIVGLLAPKTNLETAEKNKGMTALIMSVCLGYADIVEELLQVRQNIEIADESGKTAMSYALLNGDNLIVKMLRNYKILYSIN